MGTRETELLIAHGGEAAATVVADHQALQFFREEAFSRALSDTLVTSTGETIGKRNRAYLHDKLDAWIDDN